jgi:nuclease S1
MQIANFFWLLAVLAGPTHAWGPHSHEVVAEIAARHLDPEARKEVEQLLGDRADLAMREVSTWADRVRNQARYRDTVPLHYVNFPRGTCNYVVRTSCRDGRCIVDELGRQVRRMADHRLTDGERAEAMAFVIHYVGDIHQPLHAGWSDDRGGNDFQVRVGRKGMNLHSLWDDFLARQAKLRVREHVDKLLATPILEGRLQWTRNRPVVWALESCHIVNSQIYPESAQIGDDYLQRVLPIAEERIELAGRRLAVLMNTVLAEARTQ